MTCPPFLVQKGRARVEEEKTDETINPEINPDILRIHTDMSRVISAAEAAGLEGDIDTVQVSCHVLGCYFQLLIASDRICNYLLVFCAACRS